ncbi:carboxypeptidase-like regulatory domain-containing protein [Spirosoma migulaei]
MKRIHLTIDTPCQQHWQKMKSVDTGRFCDHCQKTVVDFSGLTDQQIVEVVNQSTGSTCGRFRLSQLNRKLHVPTPASQAPVRFFSLLAAGLLGYQTVKAETQPLLVVPATTQASESFGHIANQLVVDGATSTDSSRVITGRVVEKSSETGLAGVSIVLKGTSTGVSTDSAGHFQLSVPMEQKDDLITLVVASIGFQTQEIQRRPDQATPMLVNLNEDTTALGEVVVVGGYKKLSFWQRLKNRFRAGH